MQAPDEPEAYGSIGDYEPEQDCSSQDVSALIRHCGQLKRLLRE
jgi:hypothetical protein